MRCTVVLFVFVLALNCAHAQNRRKTFTSEDGAFGFQYSSMLIPCKRKPSQRNWWLPSDSCDDYSPVCYDPADPGSTTVACFACPKSKYANSNLEAAAFSVAEAPAEKRSDCAVGSPYWAGSLRRGPESSTINGVRFTTFEIADAGLGNGLEAHVYQTFHHNKCYILAIRVAWSNPANYDPGSIKVLTRQEQQELHNRLKQALDSFNFRK
jgi:hypothetical protein